MKYNKILSLLIIFSVCFFLIQSCYDEQIVEVNHRYDFLIEQGSDYLSIKTDEDLMSYLNTKSALEGKRIIEVSLQYSEDSRGGFYIGQGKYINEYGLITTVSVPFDILKNKRGNVAGGILIDAGCEMTCTAQDGCSGCQQTIHERCKRQTCSCSSMGKCKASMSFDN